MNRGCTPRPSPLSNLALPDCHSCGASNAGCRVRAAHLSNPPLARSVCARAVFRGRPGQARALVRARRVRVSGLASSIPPRGGPCDPLPPMDMPAPSAQYRPPPCAVRSRHSIRQAATQAEGIPPSLLLHIHLSKSSARLPPGNGRQFADFHGQEACPRMDGYRMTAIIRERNQNVKVFCNLNLCCGYACRTSCNQRLLRGTCGIAGNKK